MTVDATATRAWYRRFLEQNPGSTVADMMRAANGTHARNVGPAWAIAKEVHNQFVLERAASMLSNPSKNSGPSGAKPITPPVEPKEPAVAPAPKPNLPPLSTLPVSPSSPAPATKEQDLLTHHGRELLKTMRENGIEALHLIVTDTGGLPTIEGDVSYRQRNSFKLAL